MYVAAVVEYSPATASPGDTVADIVSKNTAHYVPLITQAAEQVDDITPVSKSHEEMPLGNEILSLHMLHLEQQIWYSLLTLDFILSLTYSLHIDSKCSHVSRQRLCEVMGQPDSTSSVGGRKETHCTSVWDVANPFKCLIEKKKIQA
jgi:hypothetical protein